MSVYLIGDIQGCDAPLERLLQQVAFSPSRDQLYVLGDLVNRGPDSVGVLRRLMAMGSSVQCVLGNHDLHLLAVAAGASTSKRLDTLDEVLPLIAPQRDYLQTVGLAAAPGELLPLGEALGQAGVTRICALGAMTSPEAGWHHDGRFSLLDLVRMVDIEASTEHAAERFTSYEV